MFKFIKDVKNAVVRNYEAAKSNVQAGFVKVSTLIATGLTSGLVMLGMSKASAASLIDTGMTTALTSGFTDLQDTIKGIITVAWPFIIGIAAILAAPSVVKKMISLAKS